MDKGTFTVSPEGRLGLTPGLPIIYNWHAPYGEVLDTPAGLITRPTNDLVWDQYYKMFIESERAKGQKYVDDLFKGLRFSLGLPQT